LVAQPTAQRKRQGRDGSYIAWDNGSKTSVSLESLRKDQNAARIDGALPTEFTIARTLDATAKFLGRQTFIEATDNAIWRFYDTIARHIHPWQTSVARQRIVEIEMNAETIPELSMPHQRQERRVVEQREFD
jgi:hypothetical protein